MQRPSPRHLLALNALLLAIHGEPRETALPGVLVRGLSALIDAPYVVCRIVSEADRSGRGSASDADRWAALASSYEAVRQHDPLANRRRDVPGVAAIAISDFIDRAEWRRLPFYHSFCRPLGIEDQMSIECPHGANGVLHVVISRGDYGRFTSVERWILDFLRPHLLQVCGARSMPDASADAASLIESALGEAVLIFDEMTGQLSGTAHTLRLVENVASPHELKVLPAIETWVRSQIIETRTGPRVGTVPGLHRPSMELFGLRLTLCLDGTGHRHVVSVRISTDEPRLARLRKFGLTAREAEVLLWLAHGKTNDEIGRILGLSSSTVRTHLRAIFICLGVETRTAAAASAWEVQSSLR